MSDRHYTFMLVPEKSGKVRKLVLPSIYFKFALVFLVLSSFFAIFVMIDYLHVLGQVAENKKLRIENRSLSLDVQKAKGQLENLNQSVVRLKEFANKIRVLGNLGQDNQSAILQAPKSGNIPTEASEDSGVIGGESNDNKEKLDGASLNNSKQRPQALNKEIERSERIAQITKATNPIDKVRRIQNIGHELTIQSEKEEQLYARLYESLQDRVDLLLHTPSIMPAKGWISSYYGYRINPFSGTKKFHAGIDIANNRGTIIRAPANAVVKLAGVSGGFGKVVVLDHGYNIITKFGHNSKLKVKTGDKVKRGQIIAEMGSSGRSTGPHLHYEVLVARQHRNPMRYILD